MFNKISMELLDVLDQHGNPTGEIKDREAIHRDGDWHRIIFVWIINSRGEILIQKRAPTKKAHPNLWDISFSGHVEAGADSRTTIGREAKEELGIELQGAEAEYLFTVMKEELVSNQKIHRNFIDGFLVEKNFDVGEFVFDPTEVIDARWIDWKELEKLLIANASEFAAHDEYKNLFSLLHERYDT